jgi:hypothetical protein
METLIVGVALVGSLAAAWGLQKASLEVLFRVMELQRRAQHRL